MAKRPETGGPGANPYEDFQPQSEWKEEPENNIVVVHLPGFTKEQIHITCVRSSSVVRVTGQGQLKDNKYCRCNRVFKIPQNCKIDKIYAKWHDGALTITMPKETITQPAVARKEEAKPTQEAPKLRRQAASPKAAADPKSSNDYQQVAARKAAETSVNEKQHEVKKDDGSRNAASSIDAEKKIEGRSADSFIAQKSEKEEKLQKEERKDESTFPESASTTMKQMDEGSPVPKAENIDQMKGKERVTRIENIVAESQKPETVIEKTTQVKENAFPETSEKEKEEEDKSQQKEHSILAKTMEKKSIADPAMKAVKGLSMERYGDKQLVINIGVAALVLLALGYYVPYSFGSKSKS